MDAITKYYKLGGLKKDRNLLSHSSRAQKAEIKVSSGLVPPENHEENMFQAPFPSSDGLLAIFGICWLVEKHYIISTSIFTWHFPCVVSVSKFPKMSSS